VLAVVLGAWLSPSDVPRVLTIEVDDSISTSGAWSLGTNPKRGYGPVEVRAEHDADSLLRIEVREGTHPTYLETEISIRSATDAAPSARARLWTWNKHGSPWTAHDLFGRVRISRADLSRPEEEPRLVAYELQAREGPGTSIPLTGTIVLDEVEAR
jgi:hypothetical protein